MRFCADGEVLCAQAEAKRPTRVNNPAHVITWMPMLIQLITQKIDPQIIARDWTNSGNRPADVNRGAKSSAPQPPCVRGNPLAVTLSDRSAPALHGVSFACAARMRMYPKTELNCRGSTCPTSRPVGWTYPYDHSRIQVDDPFDSHRWAGSRTTGVRLMQTRPPCCWPDR